MTQYKVPVSMTEQADHLGRLIAVIGKIATGSENWRSKAEIAHELLALAAEHGATFEEGVRERLERDANRINEKD